MEMFTETVQVLIFVIIGDLPLLVQFSCPAVQFFFSTKFCRSDNDFHEINCVTQGELLRRLVPATCRSDLSPSVSRPIDLQTDGSKHTNHCLVFLASYIPITLQMTSTTGVLRVSNVVTQII